MIEANLHVWNVATIVTNSAPLRYFDEESFIVSRQVGFLLMKQWWSE